MNRKAKFTIRFWSFKSNIIPKTKINNFKFSAPARKMRPPWLAANLRSPNIRGVPPTLGNMICFLDLSQDYFLCQAQCMMCSVQAEFFVRVITSFTLMSPSRIQGEELFTNRQNVLVRPCQQWQSVVCTIIDLS